MALILDDTNFEDEITQHEGLSVIDMWAPWCAPCRALGPIIEELSNERIDVKVGKINIDDNPELAVRFHVTSVPTILFIKNGVEVGRQIGILAKNMLDKRINNYL